MRILAVGNMYPPHHLGGYELTWRSSVRHLRHMGHTVSVLTTDYRSSAPIFDMEEDPDVHRELRWYWSDHEFPRLSARARVALERYNTRVLAQHLDRLRPHVVNWWAMGGMSLSLIERVRRAGIPGVGVVGDDWMLYGPRVDAWRRLVERMGPLGPAAAALVGLEGRLDLAPVRWLFNSEATRLRALDSGLALDHLDVVRPGIDDRLFSPRAEHPWAWRLLYVGRIDERKGIDTAVEALSQLPDKATLTVLGTGDEHYLASLRAKSERLGLSARVEFAQRRRGELVEAYAEADALLFPVRWEEPWGLVPLEAMAVGTPVVATGTGGSAEYLRDGHNALVVGRDAGAEDFAAAVQRLAAAPALRRRLREGGLNTAPEYTEQAYNEAVATALEQAAAERRR